MRNYINEGYFLCLTMVLDFLRRLWYDKEDYIRLAGDEVLQRLKRQGAFQGLSPDTVVSIDPSSGEYLIQNSLAAAIATGRQQWGHMDFYCAPTNSPPEPRNALSSSQVQRRGERVLRRLREDGQLDDIAGAHFIVIEPQQGQYIIADSVDEVLRRGEEAWPGKKLYFRPIDDERLSHLGMGLHKNPLI